MTSARDLLRPLLATARTTWQRRQLAAELQELADEQLALANADTQVGHVVRRAALDSAPRKGGRPKGSGARFIRVEPRRNGIGATIHVGRAIWQELGEPKRLDPQRIGSRLTFVPCGLDAGYSVTQPPNGMPRFSVGQDLLDTLRIEEGRFAAEIRTGAIVVT